MSHTRNYIGEGKPMLSTEIDRRRYPRFNAEIPIDIDLIDLRGGKTTQAPFKGATTDISMEGVGLVLDYPASDVLSFAPKLIGKNKEFDLHLNANLGTKGLRGIGEVRWARIYPPSLIKMGVFLKEMRDDEKEKWTNFVMSQRKSIFQNVSFRQPYSVYMLIRFLYKSIRDLMLSNLSIDYILPIIILLSSFVFIYLFVEIRYFNLIISCGIAIIMLLLTKSRTFSRKSPNRK